MTRKTGCPAPSSPPDDTDLRALVNLFEGGSFEAAVQKAAALTKVYPNSASVWNMYAAALQETGQLDTAMAAFHRAAELAPENSKLVYNLARLHQKRNEHETAIRLLERTTELQPDWAKAHLMLGLSLKKLGHIQEAIASYTRAAALSPEDARIQNSLGALLEQDDRFEEAIQSFQRAISLRPDYPEAHYNLGNILKKSDQLGRAITSYQRALKLKPDFSEAWLNLGNTLFDQERYDHSLRCFDKVISLRPNDMSALKRRGRALIANGDVDMAKVLFEDLLSRFSDDPDIHFRLGQVHKAQGDMVRAIGRYSEAYRLDSNHGGAIVALLSAPTGSLSSDMIQMLDQSRDRTSAGLSADKRLFLKAHVRRHCGDLEGAWETYVQANAVIHSRDQDLARKTIQDHERTLALLRTRHAPSTPPPRDDDLVSLFILGPSRSGKTTLETALGTSPHIKRGYENPPFIPMIQESAAAFGLRSTKRLLDLTAEAQADFLARYRARLKASCMGRHVFTDTSPHRVFNVWEIADMVPNAFFVFVQRDPLDTAVDIFKKHYQSANHYAYHPGTIYHHVAWYRQVQDILVEQLGPRAIVIEHEALRADPAQALTRIEAMLGRALGCAEPPALPERATQETAVFRSHFEAMLKRQ